MKIIKTVFFFVFFFISTIVPQLMSSITYKRPSELDNRHKTVTEQFGEQSFALQKLSLFFNDRLNKAQLPEKSAIIPFFTLSDEAIKRFLERSSRTEKKFKRLWSAVRQAAPTVEALKKGKGAKQLLRLRQAIAQSFDVPCTEIYNSLIDGYFATKDAPFPQGVSTDFNFFLRKIKPRLVAVRPSGVAYQHPAIIVDPHSHPLLLAIRDVVMQSYTADDLAQRYKDYLPHELPAVSVLCEALYGERSVQFRAKGNTIVYGTALLGAVEGDPMLVTANIGFPRDAQQDCFFITEATDISVIPCCARKQDRLIPCDGLNRRYELTALELNASRERSVSLNCSAVQRLVHLSKLIRHLFNNAVSAFTFGIDYTAGMQEGEKGTIYLTSVTFGQAAPMDVMNRQLGAAAFFPCSSFKKFLRRESVEQFIEAAYSPRRITQGLHALMRQFLSYDEAIIVQHDVVERQQGIIALVKRWWQARSVQSWHASDEYKQGCKDLVCALVLAENSGKTAERERLSGVIDEMVKRLDKLKKNESSLTESSID